MKKILVGISGASGGILAWHLLKALSGKAETHLVITDNGYTVLQNELRDQINELKSFSTFVHECDNFTSILCSGSSNPCDAMVIIPCSIKSLSAIVNCYANNVLIRAADVMIKMRRPLYLCIRETPLHIGHLRLMTQAAELGAVLTPSIPAFYHKPKSIDDILLHTTGMLLDMLGIQHTMNMRWKPEIPMQDYSLNLDQLAK